MILAVLSILVALLLGFGAVQEFFVRGIEGGEMQPLFVGLVGTFVCLLMATAGVALGRHWASTRQLVITAGLCSIVFHVVAALPPYRYVGWFALLLGAGFGLILLAVGLSSKGKQAGTLSPSVQ